MAFWFGDGFDLYSVITDCGTYWDGSFGSTVTAALSASGRFAGSRGVTNVAGQAVTPYLTRTSSINDAVHHFVVAIEQTTAFTGTNAGLWLTLYDGATAQCTVVFRSDGAILLTSGASNGTALATYPGALGAINTWYAFEIEVVINNTTGSISVRKNGNTSNDFSLGSLNTRASANNYANKLGFSFGTSANTQVVDDFLWRSDAASVPWIGDVRCFTRMPATDAAVAWSRSAGVTNASCVDEAQQNAATDYVFSSTVSQSDLYGIAAIGSTPTSIVGVTTRAYCQKSDAGTRNIAVQLQSGATNVQSASTALGTTWGHIYRVDLTDPATGSAWTATGVNNATIGVIVTA